MKNISILICLLILCSCNLSKNESTASKDFNKEEVFKILKSNRSLDDKYKKIFIDNNVYTLDLTNEEITKIGSNFYTKHDHLNYFEPQARVIVDENEKLQLYIEGSAKLKFDKNFDNYWLWVSTNVDFGNESFHSDTTIFELKNESGFGSFDNSGVVFTVRVPIDNGMSYALGKEKYIQLDSRYLAHKPNETYFHLTLVASNIVGDRYEIPILMSNFDQSWEGLRKNYNK